MTSKKGIIKFRLRESTAQSHVLRHKICMVDNIILFFILANAVLMGMQDYTVIDAEGSPSATDYRNTEKTSAIKNNIPMH